VNFLLDEQLHESAARALDALGVVNDDHFTYILDHAEQGTDDDDIPALCKNHGVQTLVTANVKDFGARKRYYEALLAEGIHVVVVRFGKAKPLPHIQVALLSAQYERIRHVLHDADGPTLVRVTASGAEPRSLEELIAEFQADGNEPLP
jgi:hypothetical protein